MRWLTFIRCVQTEHYRAAVFRLSPPTQGVSNSHIKGKRSHSEIRRCTDHSLALLLHCCAKILIKVALQESNNKRFHYSSSSPAPPPPSPEKSKTKLSTKRNRCSLKWVCIQRSGEQQGTAEPKARCEKEDSLHRRTHTGCVHVYMCVCTHVVNGSVNFLPFFPTHSLWWFLWFTFTQALVHIPLLLEY